MRILNAAGSWICVALLDRLFNETFDWPPRWRLEQLRFRSHPLQAELFATMHGNPDSAPDKKPEIRRVQVYRGVSWTADAQMPLNIVVLEISEGEVLGRLEGLYPTCPVCMERQAQETLQTALESNGLLKPRLRAPLIQCEGKPVSETIIEDRG